MNASLKTVSLCMRSDPYFAIEVTEDFFKSVLPRRSRSQRCTMICGEPSHFYASFTAEGFARRKGQKRKVHICQKCLTDIEYRRNNPAKLVAGS